MITGIFHQGSGLGNQLHRLVATRVRAADLGVDFGMIYRADNSGKEEWFKGKSFMNIDMGAPAEYETTWQEKGLYVNEIDIRSYDPEFNFIGDNTLIDGEFQDERYWEHRERDVNDWLRVEPLAVPDNLCVIGFRGGEFSIYPELFLTQDYWNEGIRRMRAINPAMQFQVHTDDPYTARLFFPDFEIIHDVGINWRSMRYAKHAIIANSSFFILPRWLRNGVTLAPRCWGRRNIGVWSMAQNYSKRFTHF